MAELLGAVQDTPLPNLLVAAGIVFVFLAVVGELTDKVKVPRERQWLMGGIGVVLLILGIGLNLVNPSTTSDDQTAEVTAGQVTPADAVTTSVAPLPGVEVFSPDMLAHSLPWLPLDSDARPATYFYVFNSEKAPFDAPAVRQALALALDRKALASLANSLGENGRPATTFTPPATLGRDLYGQVGLPFDPAGAAEHLSQAGYSDGEGFPTVTLGFSADVGNETLANAAASMWRANLGVDVVVEAVDEATYFDRLAADPPDIFALGWVADYNDPDGFLTAAFDSESPERVSSFAKPSFDRLVRQAANLADDPAARQRAYIEAERILTEQEAAIIPLYHFTQAQ